MWTYHLYTLIGKISIVQENSSIIKYIGINIRALLIYVMYYYNRHFTNKIILSCYFRVISGMYLAYLTSLFTYVVPYNFLHLFIINIIYIIDLYLYEHKINQIGIYLKYSTLYINFDYSLHSYFYLYEKYILQKIYYIYLQTPIETSKLRFIKITYVVTHITCIYKIIILNYNFKSKLINETPTYRYNFLAQDGQIYDNAVRYYLNKSVIENHWHILFFDYG